MNCFEFKKFSMSNPYSKDADFVAHQAECSECLQYLQGILAFDVKLAQAASVNCAPADFKARLKLRNIIERQERRQKKFRWMSYAAGLMLAVVAVFFGVQNYHTKQEVQIAINEKNQIEQEFINLYQTVVQHIDSEVESLTTVQATAQARMQSHLASLAGIYNVAELPGLRYSQVCPVGKHTTWHAVMDHGLGLVTAVYFKDQFPERSQAGKYDFVKVISHGENSVMLVGDSQEAVDRAEEKLKGSLSESTVI